MTGRTNASAWGGFALTLLWENQSTADAFQSLTLSLTDEYKGFVIDAKQGRSTQDAQYIRNFYSNIETNRPLCGGRYGGGTSQQYWDIYADRLVNITTTQLVIGTDYNSNDRDIPLRIYGIKK